MLLFINAFIYRFIVFNEEIYIQSLTYLLNFEQLAAFFERMLASINWPKDEGLSYIHQVKELAYALNAIGQNLCVRDKEIIRRIRKLSPTSSGGATCMQIMSGWSGMHYICHVLSIQVALLYSLSPFFLSIAMIFMQIIFFNLFDYIYRKLSYSLELIISILSAMI